MRYIAGALAFAAGALVGFGVSVTWAEKEAQRRYSESEQYRQRALDLAEQFAANRTEAPVAAPPELLDRVASEEQELAEMVKSLYAPTDLEGSGSVELITEDEFDDENGHEKHQVSVLGLNAAGDVECLVDGRAFDDHEETLGSGLARTMVEANLDVLYVRNTDTCEDFEVFLEIP